MGPCAKQRVICFIDTVVGDTYVGENLCRNPQKECPRQDGEGYEKCHSVCGQVAHAEVVALAATLSNGVSPVGATAEIFGHTYSCEACREELTKAGVVKIKINPSLSWA